MTDRAAFPVHKVTILRAGIRERLGETTAQ
jgi:hypothetical protein